MTNLEWPRLQIFYCFFNGMENGIPVLQNAAKLQQLLCLLSPQENFTEILGHLKSLEVSLGHLRSLTPFFIFVEIWRVVSAIFAIFYGIVAFEKEVFDQWFDFDHLVAFQRHAAYLMAGFICLFVISSIVGCLSLFGE